jgi:hypothetical protein
VQSLQRMICGLRGHEAVLHFEPHRLSLRCLSCGHQTTGWSLESETRREVRLTKDFSQTHTSGLGSIKTFISVFPSHRSRSYHSAM